MQRIIHVLWFGGVSLLLLLLGIGCGVNQAPTAQQSTPTLDWQIAVALNPSLMPTRNPEQATAYARKEYLEQKWNDYVATSKALPPGPVDGSPFPVETQLPTATPRMGLLLYGCLVESRSENFAGGTCWRIVDGDNFRVTYAGGKLHRDPDGTRTAGIMTCYEIRDTHYDSCDPISWYPGHAEWVDITAVQGTVLQLVDNEGQTATFDTATGIWLTIDQGTPAPTATITPTPSPTPRFSPTPTSAVGMRFLPRLLSFPPS